MSRAYDHRRKFTKRIQDSTWSAAELMAGKRTPKNRPTPREESLGELVARVRAEQNAQRKA